MCRNYDTFFGGTRHRYSYYYMYIYIYVTRQVNALNPTGFRRQFVITRQSCYPYN